MLPSLLINKGVRGYDRMVMNQPSNFMAPLSPALLKSYPHGTYETNTNKISDDLWSIGMTVFSMATGVEFTYFYDWSNYRIRYDRIKRKFDSLKKAGYSDYFTTVLNEILEETQARRIKLTNLRPVLQEIAIEGNEIINKNDPSNSKKPLQMK